MAKKQGREFASTDPTKRTQNARVQERRVSTEISLFSRSSPQHLQRSRHLISATTHRAFRASAMQTWREVVSAAWFQQRIPTNSHPIFNNVTKPYFIHFRRCDLIGRVSLA
jgi:hypothetical protein